MSASHLPDISLSGSFCAFGYVNGDGTIETQGGDWSVVRVSVGLYRVTYATPMQSIMAPITGTGEAYGTRDSITARFDNVTVNGFDVHTTEGDNGTAANVPQDSAWSFSVPCGDPIGVSIAGPAGADGATGPQGIQGPSGNDGPVGPQGPVGPAVSTSTAQVDATSSATFGLTTADIHDNGPVVQFTDKVLDAGWSRAANVISYAGDPYAVEVNASINAADVGASAYWARPKLRIIRGGNIVAVMDDLVMQAVGTYDGDFTLSGMFYDKAPGANPAYTFEWFDDETRTATLAPEAYSQITMKAVTKVTVLVP